MDFKGIARRFLQNHQTITPDTLKKLEKVLQQNVEKTLPKHPEIVGADGMVLGFALAEYHPRQKTMSFNSFNIASPAKLKATVEMEFSDTIGSGAFESDKLRGVGKTDCFNKAFSDEGRKQLGPGAFQVVYDMALKRLTVGQIKHEHALQIANNVVGWTAKYSDLFPDLHCGIGGPIRAVLLDEKHPHGFKLQ